MVVAAVPTFADVPAADGNPVMEPAAAMAADGNAVMEATTAVTEATAVMETTPAVTEATAVMEATTAAMEANTAMETTTAMEATAATMAAAAPTAPGICRGRQNHRATQHGSTCGEFRHEVQHGYCSSIPSHAYSITSVRERLFFSIQWDGKISRKASSRPGY